MARRTRGARSAHDTAPGRAGAIVAEGAGDLFIAARTLVHGLHQGAHRADSRGASTEFYDFRAAAPGDPAGSIDWKVFGRTDRHYIRRFRHETQLTVGIALDCSASMGFAGFDAAASTTKLRRAKELAAAIAHLTVKQGDRVCLACSSDPENRPIVVEPGAGWARLRIVTRSIEIASSAGDAGLPAAIRACAAMMNRRGLVVAIGDGLDEAPSLLEEIARIRCGVGRAHGRGGHDVVMIQTLTPDELDISALGRARLVDPETGASVLGAGQSSPQMYHEQMQAHLDAIRSGVVGLGGRWTLARTDEDPRRALRDLFAIRR